jgi:hypothetical protein
MVENVVFECENGLFDMFFKELKGYKKIKIKRSKYVSYSKPTCLNLFFFKAQVRWGQPLPSFFLYFLIFNLITHNQIFIYFLT